jgi:hypothetical protein
MVQNLFILTKDTDFVNCVFKFHTHRIQSFQLHNVQHILSSVFRGSYGMMRRGCLRQFNPRPELPNQKHACQSDVQKIFLDTRHLMLSKIVYFFVRPASYIVKNMCIYANTWLRRDCIWVTIVSTKYSEWNIFTKIGRDEKGWLGICHWNAVLPVTERLCDSGQDVLQSSCQTARNNSSNYLQTLGMQCRYKVTVRRFCATAVVVEKH